MILLKLLFQCKALNVFFIQYCCGIKELILQSQIYQSIVVFMEFRILYPSALLTQFVKYYWVFERNYLVRTIERGIPIGCMQLVFHRKNRVFSTAINDFQPKAFIEGHMSSYWDLQYEGENETIAITFTPQGVQAFFSTPLYEFYNKNIPVECIRDRLFIDLQQAILNADDKMDCIGIIECYLLEKIKNLKPEIAVSEVIIQQIEYDCNTSIEWLANVSNHSYKQFCRNFMKSIGINPKQLARIIRFQNTLATLQAGNKESLSALAFRCGYYDASHITREFKEFSGYTLNEYINIYNPFSDYFLQKELIQNRAYDKTCID